MRYIADWAMIRASGHYLCDNLPDNFSDWDDDTLVAFIDENKWEPFENYPSSHVLECIEALAMDFLEIAGTD